MKRNRKALLIAGIALLVVTGAFLALLFWPQTEAPEPSPSPSPSSERPVLVEILRNEVSHITVTSPDKTVYSLINNTEVAEVSPAAQGFSYSLSAVNSYFSAALNITADKVVAENPTEQELKDYGFAPDAPVTECTIARKDGSSVTLIISKLSVTGSGYYVQVSEYDGSGNHEIFAQSPVYLISKYKGDTLLQGEPVLRDLSFIPAYEADQDPATQLVNVLWTKDGANLEIRLLSEEELANLALGGSSYEIVQPIVAGGNDTVIGENVLTPIVSIAPSKVVEDNPADLADFGLDEPVTLTLTDANGWVGTLFIGGVDPETNGRYVMLPGTTSVLLDESGDYSFLDISLMRLRNKLVFLYSIKDVVKAENTLDGVTRVLTLDDREATDTEEASLTASLDGKDITETNARRIYTGMISFALEAELPADAVPGETAYRQVFTMWDGTTHSLELRPINERHFAIYVDGENTGYYVNIKHMNFLREAYAANDAGKEVPRP